MICWPLWGFDKSTMKPRPDEWAVFLYDWVDARIKFVIANKSQILQVTGTIFVLIISACGLQYVPFLAGWLHISDMQYGKILVYSLPIWVILAVFIIWRS